VEIDLGEPNPQTTEAEWRRDEVAEEEAEEDMALVPWRRPIPTSCG
jgi:hypothetical protein